MSINLKDVNIDFSERSNVKLRDDALPQKTDLQKVIRTLPCRKRTGGRKWNATGIHSFVQPQRTIPPSRLEVQPLRTRTFADLMERMNWALRTSFGLSNPKLSSILGAIPKNFYAHYPRSPRLSSNLGTVPKNFYVYCPRNPKLSSNLGTIPKIFHEQFPRNPKLISKYGYSSENFLGTRIVLANL